MSASNPTHPVVVPRIHRSAGRLMTGSELRIHRRAPIGFWVRSPLGHVSSSSDLRRCFLAFIHGWRYCRSTPWGFNSLPEFTNSPIEAISNTCAPERASERQERRLGVGGQFAGFLGRDGPA